VLVATFCTCDVSAINTKPKRKRRVIVMREDDMLSRRGLGTISTISSIYRNVKRRFRARTGIRERQHSPEVQIQCYKAAGVDKGPRRVDSNGGRLSRNVGGGCRVTAIPSDNEWRRDPLIHLRFQHCDGANGHRRRWDWRQPAYIQLRQMRIHKCGKKRGVKTREREGQSKMENLGSMSVAVGCVTDV